MINQGLVTWGRGPSQAWHVRVLFQYDAILCFTITPMRSQLWWSLNLKKTCYGGASWYRLFFFFPMHLLHFSHWGKKIEKCGDLIWDQTNQGYLSWSMATSTKIKSPITFELCYFWAEFEFSHNTDYVSRIPDFPCTFWSLFGSIWSRPD